MFKLIPIARTSIKQGLFSLAIVLIVGSVSFFLFRGFTDNESPAFSFSQSDKTMAEFDPVLASREIDMRLLSVGPERTAQELVNTFVSSPVFRVSHRMAHIFGDRLYQKFGVGGIGYCFAEFNSGCYHQLFGVLLSSGDTDTMARIDTICSNLGSRIAIFGCYHGAGHGLISMNGYDINSLETALGECAAMTGDPFDHCPAGAFMEFNYKYLSHGMNDDISYRQPSDDLYFPCSTVQEHFRMSCYVELPKWWKLAEIGNFKRFGELCLATPDARERLYCFWGIGQVAGIVGARDAAKTFGLCAHMPEAHISECTGGAAAFSYVLDEGGPSLAHSICSMLPQNQVDECDMDSDLGFYGKIHRIKMGIK